MTPAIGDIVYCTIPFKIDITTISEIVSFCEDSSNGYTARVVILDCADSSLIAMDFGTMHDKIHINFGQTDLVTIRQTHPELLI